MSKLKRLAKLKQFDKDSDPKGYLFKEFRQNLMAIEAAFNENNQYMFANVAIDNVPNDETAIVPFSDPVDPSNLINGKNIILASDGTYLFDFTLNGLTARDFQVLSLNCYVNQELAQTIPLISNNDLLPITICARASFYLALKRTDSIYFILSSISAGSAIEPIMWSSGMLKIEQF